MKKLLLAILMFPLLAHASNWVLVSTTTTGDKFKVDTTSIVRNGNEVTYWEIMNYAKRSADGELSAKDQVAVNCLTKEFSTKYIQLFSDYDARGTMINTFKASGTWSPIPPDTAIETVMKFVCKR